MTCRQQTTKKNYYLPTTNNKTELLPVHNTQHRGIITCLQQATKGNYYLSTTNKKDELLPVYNKEELLPVYNKQQQQIITMSTTRNKEKLLPF
jgi:hypothetical protein